VRLMAILETHRMRDEDKTREQLINELVELRRRITELEKLETKRKQAEEALQESEEKFRSISASAQDGIIMMDNEGNISYWNEAAQRIFGYTKGEAIGKEVHIFLGPKRYHEAYRKGFNRFKETGEGPVVEKTLELSAIRKDGTEFPIELSVSSVKVQGKWHSIGIVRDITRRKQAEEALRKAHEELEKRVEERTAELVKANEELRERERRFTDIAENVLEWVWEVDTNGKYTYASPVVEKILGYKPKEVFKKNFYELFHPEDREELRKTVFGVFAKKQPFREFINRNVHKNGKTVWLSTSGVPILDEKGNLLGYRGVDADITERKRMEEALEASEQKYRELYKKAKILAEKDPLTKLFNHRRISELLEYEIQRAKRKEEVFSIMMLDVDDLKLINDAYGHLAGDKLLKNIAGILKNSCRSIDLIGRYGGDEFLIILPYTHGEKAKNIAQRICEKMQKQGLKINGTKNIPTRLSIGVTTYPFDSMVSRELIGLADKRMYESKQSGKSVVSVSVPEIKKYLLAKKPTLNILESLVTAVDGKDHYTKAHSELVNKFSFSLAKEVNLSNEEIEALRIAALLHDIGKIGIPETILRKPGPLEKEEFELIKQHPILGAMMLDGPPLHRDHVIDAIKYHHERYDGKGYPGELKGKDIPLLARIIGIVDAYCAMITDRPYRKALTQEEAIAELKKCAGTQFDPELVDKFIKCLKEA